MSWTLSNMQDGETTSRLAGYAVLDALGVRLGHVSGWVTDPDGRIRMLKVAVTEWEGSSDYLVPLGAVTLISDATSTVQLRKVTKQSIGRLCYRYRGELPAPRLLKTLLRHFHPPRASLVERLARKPRGPHPVPLSWTRLSDYDEPGLS